MKLPTAIAIMATAVLMPAYGAAETVPDMKGTWVTTSTDDSVVYGQSEHHPEFNRDTLFFSQGPDPFTLTIDQPKKGSCFLPWLRQANEIMAKGGAYEPADLSPCG